MKRRFSEQAYRNDPWFRALCSALLSSKTEEQMAEMLRDVGTLSELQAWSERLEVAKQLVQGLSYREISKKTGASTTTVTRVAKFLENGPGGYRRFLNVKAADDDSKQVYPKTADALRKYLDRGDKRPV